MSVDKNTLLFIEVTNTLEFGYMYSIKSSAIPFLLNLTLILKLGATYTGSVVDFLSSPNRLITI